MWKENKTTVRMSDYVIRVHTIYPPKNSDDINVSVQIRIYCFMKFSHMGWQCASFPKVTDHLTRKSLNIRPELSFELLVWVVQVPKHDWLFITNALVAFRDGRQISVALWIQAKEITELELTLEASFLMTSLLLYKKVSYKFPKERSNIHP